MRHAKKWIAAFLLLAGLALVNIIASRLPGQLDLTGERLYTLSDGSRSLLKKLDEPVILNFYFSRSLPELPIAFKNYATRVEELLRQYQAAAPGFIDLRVIEPEPDTEEEDRAIRAGVGNQMTPSGGNLFFGLQAIHANQEAVIEFFTLEREPFLEYDISRLIHEVRQLQKPTIGVLSGLPVLADFSSMQMPQMDPRNMPQDWVFLQELRQSFEIREIEAEATELPEDLDLLALIHPPQLNRDLQYSIDQFLLGGSPVFLAIDPSSVHQKENQPGGGMMGMQMPQPTSSNLPTLLPGWGILYKENEVVADEAYAATIRAGQGGMPLRYPVWMQVTSFSGGSPAVADLNLMLFPEAGHFTLAETTSNLTLTPFVQTSGNGGTVDAQMLRFASPDTIAKQIKADSSQRTLAGLVRGKFNTAFPDGPPPPEPATEDSGEQTPDPDPDPDPRAAKHLSRSITDSNLVIVADSDFLSDRFSVQFINFLGTRAIQPLNNNIAFTSNIIEFMSGSSDLLRLRTKGSAHRPFTRVEKLQAAAQTAYQERLDALNAQLSEVQGRLNELQQQQRDSGALIATPEIRQAIEDFRKQEANLRSERREIRKSLREDIEALNRGLALVNLTVTPVLVGLFGIYFFSRRNKRR